MAGKERPSFILCGSCERSRVSASPAAVIYVPALLFSSYPRSFEISETGGRVDVFRTSASVPLSLRFFGLLSAQSKPRSIRYRLAGGEFRWFDWSVCWVGAAEMLGSDGLPLLSDRWFFTSRKSGRTR